MSYKDNDSGGMDEEQAIKKMIKIVESFNKTMKGGIDLTEKSQVQLMKSILSHQKAYKTDKDHQMWKEQSIEQTKKAHIAVFAERQKELRLSKLINKSLSTQVNTYDKVFKTLGSRTGFGNALSLMTGRLNEMRKTTELITSQQKILAKETAKGAGGDSGAIKSATEAIDVGKKSLEKLTFNNETLKKVAKRLEKLGEFMEKHQGKLIIGAAAISILTAIISKALNVAPLFQAMMKLMQFAVTMFLMPIGTFFGAVIRPMVVGLVKKMAPEFGTWMKNAMKIGDSLGAFLIGNSTLFDNVGQAIENLAKWTGIPDSLENLSDEEKGGLIVGAGAAVVATGAVIAKQIYSKAGNFFGANNGKTGTSSSTYSPSSSGGGSSFKDPPTGKGQKGISTYLKELIQKVTKGKAIKGGLAVGGAMLLLEMFLPMDDIVANINKTFRDATGQNENHNELFASGYNLAGEGMGERDMNYLTNGQTTPFSGNTPNIDEVNSLMASINAPAKWMQDQPTMDKLVEILGGDDVKDIGKSMENAGSMAEKFEEVVTIMGTENAPVMDMQMSLIMNMFINMKKMGATANEAAIRTAENFSLADKTIQAKLKSWVRQVKSAATKENPNTAAIREATNAQSSYMSGQSDADNFFGGSGYVNPWTKSASTVETLADKKIAAAEAAKVAFDKANGKGAYDSIYGGANGQGNNSYNDDGNDGSDTGYTMGTSAEAQKILNSVNASNIPLTSTGAVDWAARLADNPNAAGGWINEPVKGIGMNTGQTYSIGERGAEFVSPNGGGSGGGVTINIAKIERTADFNQLKPMIQRWILEANSRRGMI